jgi:intermembrane space import and assembly protein 40
MQNCFREYPEVYGSELEGDDEDGEEDMPANASTDSAPPSTLSGESSPPRTKSQPETSTADQGHLASEPSSQPTWQPQSAEKVADKRPGLDLVPNSYRPDDAKKPEPVSESEHLVPKAAHDAVEKK